jgi:hypothetical protein
MILLAGDRLCGIKPLFQAKPGFRLAEPQDTGAVRQLEEKHFDIALHSASLASKAKFCQHLRALVA